MNIESAFRTINESIDSLVNVIRELNIENKLLKEENSELRKLIGELMLEQIENEF